ncbi:hypothetical protein C0029_16890 [Halioglobus japonicus]|uniref:Uncharacterized protein n=2 Tax=Halioglobus japonicus TaxID=930805 RepID=A0AAP8MBE0_9GAMM|nr:hypothetical protein C0029_16890 [Halioglobus japonicus]
MLPKTLFEIFAQYVKSDGLEDVGRVFCSRLLAAIAIKIQPSTPVFAALQAHAQLFIVGCIGIVPQLAAVSKPPFSRNFTICSGCVRDGFDMCYLDMKLQIWKTEFLHHNGAMILW